jgi:hypothetical protein
MKPSPTEAEGVADMKRHIASQAIVQRVVSAASSIISWCQSTHIKFKLNGLRRDPVLGYKALEVRNVGSQLSKNITVPPVVFCNLPIRG